MLSAIGRRTGLPILVSLILVGCKVEWNSEDERTSAIEMARDMVLSSSRHGQYHVEIDAHSLLTSDVQRTEGGGWMVTLVHGNCIFKVYENPNGSQASLVADGCTATAVTPSNATDNRDSN
jgi:hypothetical protein